MLAETPRPLDVAAAGAPPEVGRDEPHRASAPRRRETSSATGCQDSAFAVMPCAAMTSGCALACGPGARGAP